MAKYVTREAENGLWTVIEEETSRPVAGRRGIHGRPEQADAEALAARMNAEAAEGKDERG